MRGSHFFFIPTTGSVRIAHYTCGYFSVARRAGLNPYARSSANINLLHCELASRMFNFKIQNSKSNFSMAFGRVKTKTDVLVIEFLETPNS